MKMFNDNCELSFYFFDVGGGDAILIRFLGNDSKWHNILIDGGYGKTYKNVFGPLIRNLNDKECIDLWIISHTDMDHIGTVLGFTQDVKITDKRNKVKKFWFNHSPLTISVGNGKIGVAQGIKLREYLSRNDLLIQEVITTELPPADLYGLKITVLSPTIEKQRIAEEEWQMEERGGKLGRTVEKADHQKTIEELRTNDFGEDTDVWNGSSIACLVEYKSHQALLLADSHPTTIIETLKSLNVSIENPLEVCFVQLAHHGSKANTNVELLNMIRTSTYVITGNGITNRHPDKETLVRVLTQKNRNSNVEFLFPLKTDELAGLFNTDTDAFSRYQFSCIYPEAEENHINLKFSCIPRTDNE